MIDIYQLFHKVKWYSGKKKKFKKAQQSYFYNNFFTTLVVSVGTGINNHFNGNQSLFSF